MAKLGGKEENRVREDGRWDIVMTFALVADMNETMIYAHFKFIWRLVAITLIFVKLFETL